MKRAYTFVAISLSAVVLGSAGFIAAYATSESRLLEGLALALAAAGLSAAALGWAFGFLRPAQVIDRIETYPSPEHERTLQSAVLRSDAEELSRPRLLAALLFGALGSFALALLVPIRSLGPKIGDTLFHTAWRRGSRVVREDGSVVRASDLVVGTAETVFPEGAVGDAASQAVLIRLPTEDAAGTDGYVAYSRVCTHAGCPVALYRASVQQLMCPCHQSVFDVMQNGAVVSGPADHALPKLSIVIGDDGELRAAGDFSEPVGPGFWERA